MAADLIEVFDGWADRRFDPLRGRPAIDRVMYTASIVGEDARVWLVITALMALRPGSRRKALRLLVWLGIETVLVNGPMKAAFGRERPVSPDVHPYALRVQKSSSFPSGHSASSATMATILSDGSRLAPAWWVLALVIAFSRVHVRDHHASDIVGGLAVGTALGVLGRHLGPRDRPSPQNPSVLAPDFPVIGGKFGARTGVPQGMKGSGRGSARRRRAR